ncbi:hypothetical protein [Streptomyces sp. NPDC048419]
MVEDASRRSPRPLPFDPTQPGGFGWLLMQDLALDVPRGKTVSVVLPLSQ